MALWKETAQNEQRAMPNEQRAMCRASQVKKSKKPNPRLHP